MPARWRWVIAGVAIFAVGFMMGSNLLLGRNPLAKPFFLAPEENQLPVLEAADDYAEAISRYDFQTAKAMGTEENARMLDTEVKPALDKFAELAGVERPSFTSRFEKALLVNQDLDHVYVIESLNLHNPVAGKRGIYVKFEIRKVGGTYRVLRTATVEMD